MKKAESRWHPRIELLIAFVALLMAGISLYLDYRDLQKSTAPNVQMESLTGTVLLSEARGSKRVDLKVQACVRLTNHGGAIASLVNASWDALDPYGLIPAKNAWIAIRDSEPNEESFDEHRHISAAPILGVDNTTLFPGKPRTFWIIVSGHSEGTESKGVLWTNIRVRLLFSNGQEIVFVPTVDRFELTETFEVGK